MFKHLKPSLVATTLILLLHILWGCNDTTTRAETTQSGRTTGTPLLVDLGASKCIPCQKMAPLLEQLHQDFQGQLGVEFIDVWENREQAAAYNIRMIPTQIFYASDGTELFRHTGFYSRKQILQKWKELGYSFRAKN